MTSMPNSMPVRVTYNGKAYDIPRDFVVNEHPGGADAIFPYEDGDMTRAFEDVGHSDDAVDLLKGWQVAGGETQEPDAAVPVKKDEDNQKKGKEAPTSARTPAKNTCSVTCVIPWVVAICCAAGMYALLTRRQRASN
jgi:cytochrome b involved in lipid metabolism